MTTFNERADALLREVWGEIKAAERKTESDAAKANPDRHRLTRVMESGKGTNYSYWPGALRWHGKRRREQTSFCVSHHRNAAGSFLLWREVSRYRLKGKKWTWYETERFDYQWGPSKTELRALAATKAARDKTEHAHAMARKLPDAPAGAKAILAAAIG